MTKMRYSKGWQLKQSCPAVLFLGLVCCGVVLSSCSPKSQQPPGTQLTESKSSSAQETKAALKSGKASKTLSSQRSGAVAGTPVPSATMTVSQAQGVDILKALNANTGMQGHKISVGTGQNTVWLDGSVTKPAQRGLAEAIVKKESPNSKIVNHLKIAKN